MRRRASARQSAPSRGASAGSTSFRLAAPVAGSTSSRNSSPSRSEAPRVPALAAWDSSCQPTHPARMSSLSSCRHRADVQKNFFCNRFHYPLPLGNEQDWPHNF